MPWPPSINHYYLHTSNGVILGGDGRKYRRDACLLLSKYRGYCGAKKRLNVIINLFPPDKRRRDIDNVLKCLLDSMQHAQIYEDDNQIDMLTVVRREVIKEGCVQIWISECS